MLVMKARGSAHVSDRVMSTFGKGEAMSAAKATLAPDALLCTDGTGVYKAVESELGIKVEKTGIERRRGGGGKCGGSNRHPTQQGPGDSLKG